MRHTQRRARIALIAGAFCGIATMFVSLASRAQRPVSQTAEYSPYEKETIQRALQKLKLTADPTPQGKRIRRITTERLEILEDRDPVPDAVLGIPVRGPANSLHYVSRDYVIRREMLVHEGEAYDQVIVDEVARNMRSRMPLQVSLVLLVPIQTEEPGTVDILIITKEIWSLRLSTDFAVTPGGVENLTIVPQETNLLGWHHTASTGFQYRPESYTFSLGYKVPRFGYSWVGASASAGITINRRSGEPEGSSANLTVAQALYSTRTDWAWSASAGYAIGVARRYSNAHVFAYDARATPENDGIPFQYKSRTFTAGAGVTRSFGWGFKNDFSLTFNASKSEYDTFDLSAFDPAAVAEFRARALPTGDARVYPMLTWATYSNSFMRTLDVNTLALQEDFRLGHEVTASIYPVTRALGSARDFIGVSAKAAYTVALGDGLAGANVTTFAEDQDGTISDGSIGGALGVVTPRLGFGRLVMNASFLNRYKNFLNARSFTGGSDRLRGYPSNYFFGKDTIFYNLEFRSRPIRIWTLAVGAVAFYDAGDAAQGFDMLRPKQSVGGGIRFLVPQVNRPIFRFDVAVPLKRGPFPETGSNQLVPPVGFYFAIDQAFSP